MKKRSFFALCALAGGCSSPSLDGTQWRCETQADCVQGYVCSTGRKTCVQPDNSADGVEATRIVLGMTGPLTSGATSIGQSMREGMEAYFARVNSSGGLDGRQVELVALDDGGDPDQALLNVQQLVENKQVFAFVGNVGTAAATKTAPYLVGQQVLSFGGRAGGAALRKDPPDRYVFNYRAGLTEELSQAVGYLTGVRSPTVPAENIALFAEGIGSSGQFSELGQEGLDALAETLRVSHGISASDVVAATYPRGTTDVDDAVGVMLRWLGSERVKDVNNQIIASIALVAEPEPAADFIRSFLDELFKIQRGTSPGLEFGLTASEVSELQNVADVQFYAISSASGDKLAEELKSFGTVLTAQGERPYCSNLLMTQVVPPLDSNASGLIEFRERPHRLRPQRSTRLGEPGGVSGRPFVLGGCDSPRPQLEHRGPHRHPGVPQ